MPVRLQCRLTGTACGRHSVAAGAQGTQPFRSKGVRVVLPQRPFFRKNMRGVFSVAFLAATVSRFRVRPCPQGRFFPGCERLHASAARPELSEIMAFFFREATGRMRSKRTAFQTESAPAEGPFPRLSPRKERGLPPNTGGPFLFGQYRPRRGLRSFRPTRPSRRDGAEWYGNRWQGTWQSALRWRRRHPLHSS